MEKFCKIPQELKNTKNWICWRSEPDPKAHSGIKKLPVDAVSGFPAKSNDPSTWCSFETAVNACRFHNYAGIGFNFSNSEFFGVDIDDCKEEIEKFEQGDKNSIIYEFLSGLQSYAEKSQSGNGIHIICRGTLPTGARRKGKIEMYDKGRYFVMTGNRIGNFAEVCDCTEKIKTLHKKYLGEQTKTRSDTPSPPSTPASLSENEIISKIQNSKQREKFNALYSGDVSGFPSHSEADLAFCSMLAFWCGGDADKIDSIYRSSGLMRDKWDRKQLGSTYGKLTIQKAVSGCNEFYSEKPHDDYFISIKNPSPDVQPQQEHSQIKRYSLDDTGNSQRFFDTYGYMFRYSYTDKCWLYYADGKWHYDDYGMVNKGTDGVLERIKKEEPAWESYENGAFTRDFQKHLKKSRSHNSKVAMIKEFEHLVPIKPSELDRHKTLINCKNGVIDLETGELLSHKREYYMTKMLGTHFPENPKQPEKWLKFLDEIFDGDKELIRYIQKMFGYNLSGITSEQCIFIMYGTGRNGKSVLVEIMRSLLGEYSVNMQPESLMVKPVGNSANSDIARLKGARSAVAQESNDGMRLNEGLIKQLTGGDAITARRLYGNEFEFYPEFKLCLVTNHKPIIRGNDFGIWRRLKVIPFTVTIPDEKVNKNLTQELLRELPDILAWAVEGFRLWRAEGLPEPFTILEATKEYKHEMDVIAMFLDSDYIQAGGEIQASTLYAVYCQWASESNEYKMPLRKFSIEMSKKFNKIRRTKGWYYQDISLAGITI